MALFRNYDPGRIILVTQGIQIQGIADGTFVKAARNEDNFTDKVGAGGDVVHVRNRNRSGKITFTLQDASPSNDALSQLAITDELTGLSYGPTMIKDLNGTTLVQSANTRIAKYADLEYAKDAGDNEWVIICAELEMFLGGEVV